MNLLDWRAFAGLGVLAVTAHFLAPAGARGVIYLAVGTAGVAAVLLGVRRHRPVPAAPWYLFAAGLGLFLIGDGFFYFYKLVRHVERPFPSLADAFYLASYPVTSAGLLALIRRRIPGGDRPSLIDASIIATGMALLWELFLIAPYLSSPDTPLLDRVISTAYPVADVALLAVALRLAVGAGSRLPSFVFLGLAIASLLVADMAYGIVQVGGNFELGTSIDAGWMGFYLFWGLAALHPTMRTLSQPTPPPNILASRRRLVVLGAVVLVPPAVMVVQVARGEYAELLLPAGSLVVLVLLVMARMNGLLGSLAATAARERALRTAAASLVATTDRRSVYRATVEATRELLGATQAVVRMALWSDAELASATSRSAPRAGATGGGAALEPAPSVGEEPVGLADLSRILEDPLGLGRPAKSTVVAPVVVQDDLQGAIVVASDDRLPVGLSDTLDTLGSQVAMALESVGLTEDLHHRRGEARLAALVQNSSDVITVMDPDTTVRYQTPSVEQVLGYPAGALDGTRLVELVHPSDLARGLVFFEEAAAQPGTSAPVELRIRRPDGTWQDVEAVSNNLLGDRNVEGIVVTVRDIGERKAFERRLTEQAFHDALTGLANRSLFGNRLEHALNRRRRDPGAVAVMFIDLDDFKNVNDSLGHAAGDSLLQAVAERITGCLRPGDTTARLGGDEFAVLIDGVGDKDVPVHVAGRVLEAVRAPFVLDHKEVDVSASLGIALSGDGATTAEELLRNADIAMYMAKSRSKGGYEIFEPRMHEAALQRLNLKADLQRALEHDELVLHYQPILDLATARPVGFEALVRWQHPERGLLGPVEFIPLAEETGLIVGLGRRVLEVACRQARRWLAAHGTTMSVNLSRKQIVQPGLVEDVAAILEAAGLPPGALTLEITESLVMHDLDATVAVLHRLRNLGVRIAIDDFGTGYSSLASLRHLPVDVLKIDKAFVDGVATSQEDRILVNTVVDLARGLGMATVAEGIEDQDQLAALRAAGCSHGQGYHFARPLPPAQAEALLGGPAGGGHAPSDGRDKEVSRR